MRLSKSPLALTKVAVMVPRYWIGPMKAQSKKLPGCVRKNEGSESHFGRVMIERGLRERVDLDACKEHEISMSKNGEFRT